MNLVEALTKLRDLYLALLKALQASQTNADPENDKPPPPPPKPPPTSKIPLWAKAIQKEEGGRPTDLNMRLNNPGNLKYSSLTAALGGVKATKGRDGGNFCKWPTYQAGFTALCKFLRMAATDQLRSYRSSMSIDLFTQVYAHPPKNHPYAENVAKALGVSAETAIHDLL